MGTGIASRPYLPLEQLSAVLQHPRLRLLLAQGQPCPLQLVLQRLPLLLQPGSAALRSLQPLLEPPLVLLQLGLAGFHPAHLLLEGMEQCVCKLASILYTNL